MSFEIGGVTYTPKSTVQYASEMLAYINADRTSRGESQLLASTGNAIWLFCLAGGNVRAYYDLVVQNASESFQIDVCTPAQILNLLPIAGTSLIPATFTTLTIQVTAQLVGDVELVAGNQAVFTPDIKFLVNDDTTIPAGTTVDVLTTANIAGPINVVPGQITNFVEAIANLQSVNNSGSSIPGRAEETINQVRTRLLQGNILTWGVDGLIRSLLAIQGITQATAYFNPDSDSDLVLPGGATIPPRFAQIFVIGEDTTDVAIANAYARSMNAPTQGAESQNYITLAGQNIEIKYDFGTEQPVYVKVYYDDTQPTQAGFESLIKDAIVLSVAPLIGQAISTEMVIEPLINFNYASILGAEVSLDGISYSYVKVIDADSVATFSTANITVVAG